MIIRFTEKEWARLFLPLLMATVLAACSDATELTTTENSQPEPEVSLGYARINESNENDPLDTHIYELDNGLQVYLTENHEEPRFYAEIAVRAGSKHDPADGTGLAHYLEHLYSKEMKT